MAKKKKKKKKKKVIQSLGDSETMSSSQSETMQSSETMSSSQNETLKINQSNNPSLQSSETMSSSQNETLKINQSNNPSSPRPSLQFFSESQKSLTREQFHAAIQQLTQALSSAEIYNLFDQIQTDNVVERDAFDQTLDTLNIFEMTTPLKKDMDNNNHNEKSLIDESVSPTNDTSSPTGKSPLESKLDTEANNKPHQSKTETPSPSPSSPPSLPLSLPPSPIPPLQNRSAQDRKLIQSMTTDIEHWQTKSKELHFANVNLEKVNNDIKTKYNISNRIKQLETSLNDQIQTIETLKKNETDKIDTINAMATNDTNQQQEIIQLNKKVVILQKETKEQKEKIYEFEKNCKHMERMRAINKKQTEDINHLNETILQLEKDKKDGLERERILNRIKRTKVVAVQTNVITSSVLQQSHNAAKTALERKHQQVTTTLTTNLKQVKIKYENLESVNDHLNQRLNKVQKLIGMLPELVAKVEQSSEEIHERMDMERQERIRQEEQRYGDSISEAMNFE